MFPSPYGVSFILINGKQVANADIMVIYVSVSLRSIIHSYDINKFNEGIEL